MYFSSSWWQVSLELAAKVIELTCVGVAKHAAGAFNCVSNCDFHNKCCENVI